MGSGLMGLEMGCEWFGLVMAVMMGTSFEEKRKRLRTLLSSCF